MDHCVAVTLVDPDGPKPFYATSKSAGLDLSCRVDTQVSSHEFALIPTNTVIAYPPEYAALLLLRSSTPMRYGLISANGIGLIDRDYCGKDDEIKVAVYNPTEKPITIARGERIAQLVFVRNNRLWPLIGHFAADKSRGGFGSTG